MHPAPRVHPTASRPTPAAASAGTVGTGANFGTGANLGNGVTFALVAGVPPVAVLDLRHEVFVLEQGVPADLERDGSDATADHAVLVGADGPALATARLLVPSGGPEPGAGRGRFGVVGRVAVRRSHRGRGLGRLVTEALEQLAAARGLTAIELHAQQRAEGFYRRAGYLPRAARFGPVRDTDAGIAHIWMRRDLVLDPVLVPGVGTDGRLDPGELWVDSASPDALEVLTRLGYAPTGREREPRERSGALELEYRRDPVGRGPVKP